MKELRINSHQKKIFIGNNSSIWENKIVEKLNNDVTYEYTSNVKVICNPKGSYIHNQKHNNT